MKQSEYDELDVQERQRELNFRQIWEDAKVSGGEEETQLIRVVLADDHPKVRAGIRGLLAQTPDIQVVGEAANGLQALELVEQLEPDVLLLDVEMPIMTGAQVAEILKKSGSPVRILVLSAYNDQQYILDMLENGASGYLIKDEVPEILVSAVRGVARGAEGWVSECVAERITAWQKKHSFNQHTLTFREIDVLRLVSDKKNDQEIATQLNMSEETVRRYVEILLVKLNARSRIDLIIRAEQFRFM